MSEYMTLVIKSVDVLCNHIARIQSIEVERFRIASEAETMRRKISVIEKVALERLEQQKMVLERSLSMVAEDLSSLSISREILIRALEKLTDKIISEETKEEHQGILLQALNIIREELNKIREDSEIRFDKIAGSIVTAMKSPLNHKLIEGDEFYERVE